MLSTLREIPRAESKPLPIIGDSNTNFAADFHVKIRGKTESGKSGATRDKVRVFGKASAKNGDTPIIVEKVVSDIDEIVRHVRFNGWQSTHAGEREVKKALRKTLFKFN